MGEGEADAVTTGVDMEKVGHFVEIERNIARLESNVKVLKRERDAFKADLLVQFVEAGLQNVTQKDGANVHLHSTFRASKAKGVTKEQVCEALEAADLADFVSPAYVPRTLESYFREQFKKIREKRPDADPEEALPEGDLRAFFNAIELVDVRVLGK